MTAIREQLASALNRNDEAPNIALAQRIASANDTAAVAELIATLDDHDQSLRSDALKVLYETGKLQPDLIAGYGDRFVQLLADRHNRMVWGGMEALAAVARVDPQSLLPHLEEIMDATRLGSVITRDWGVRVLTSIAVAEPGIRKPISAFLLDTLTICKASEFPRHAESMEALLAIDYPGAAAFRQIAEIRQSALSRPQVKRTERVLRSLSDSNS